MDFGMPLLFPFLRIAAAIAVVIAVLFAWKLYRETDRGWYWGCLVLSAFFMAAAQWLFIVVPLLQTSRPHERGLDILPVLQDASEIIASLLFAVACYGIYSTMHKIRKRVE